MSLLTKSPAWQALQTHFQAVRNLHMRDLFAQDPQRFKRFSLRFKDILLDFSKNRINEDTLGLLRALAKEQDVSGWITRMFRGDKINHTEQRAVLHVALRNRSGQPVQVDGQDVMPDVTAMWDKMRQFSEAVRCRKWLGYSGQTISDVVNIGVGGSDLGPLMVTEALRSYAIHDLRVHFVSNVDENHINDTLARVNHNTTLFIIASKSFTTQDTLVNAEAARDWFLQRSQQPDSVAKHFVAVTNNVSAAREFGIEAANIFTMWDWVGGRFSMWSCVGLSIAIAIGMDKFEQMLQGAHDMDEHFRTAPLAENLPVTLALLGIWYNNFFNAESYAVLPYDQHLEHLPAYLRQMDMESNGKRVDRHGKVVEYSTGPIVFGQLGITGQHAFYQLLHQGTKLIPADIIAPISIRREIKTQHLVLLANVFAQTEALMCGKTEQEARAEMQAEGMPEAELMALLPYKVFPGNKPTNTILFRTLDPQTLGSLVALYEHKVFVQGIIWGINSFDQWGVELGKLMAKRILPELNNDKPVTNHDSSTNGLINYYKVLRNKNNSAGDA